MYSELENKTTGIYTFFRSAQTIGLELRNDSVFPMQKSGYKNPQCLVTSSEFTVATGESLTLIVRYTFFIRVLNP